MKKPRRSGGMSIRWQEARLPTKDEFQRARRRKSDSRYRVFLRDLRPGEVGEWPIEPGRKPESVRSAFWWAAVQEGIKIETTVQGEMLWILRVEDPESSQSRSRAKKNPG